MSKKHESKKRRSDFLDVALDNVKAKIMADEKQISSVLQILRPYKIWFENHGRK